MPFALLIDRTDDYEPPDIHGPFDSLEDGQAYAERWRNNLNLPAEATPENNDTWTKMGWYFGIFEMKREFFANETT